MKKFIFLTIIAFSTSFVNAQWQQTNYSFGGYIFTNCMATNGTDVYVCNNSSGIYRTTDNGNTWSAVNNGLPTNPQVKALAINGTSIFAGVTDGVYLSTNNGNNWTHLTNGLPSVNFYPSVFAISGSNIFVGTGTSIGTADGIHLSTNNGSSWYTVNNGLPTNDNITSLAISGTNIYAGTENNGIFLSTNNGSNWAAMNNGIGLAEIKSLVVKNSYVFATTYNTVSDGVYLSTNNGSSWTAVNNGISYAQYCILYALAISGSNIFTAGFSAMTASNVAYFSNNDGNNWVNVSSGLPAYNSNTIQSLVINNLYIFAGTMDGTVWKCSLSQITEIENINNNKEIDIFPNPAKNEITINNPNATQNTLISIRNIQGRELIQENVNGTTNIINISKLENGIYFLTLQNEKESYVRKIVIQK